MVSKIPVFITGATGYIGGSVLARLLSHPNASTFDITALVRSPEKAEKLRAFGVTPVLGSLKDLDLLEALSSKAHIVFSFADCDDLPSTVAVLKGLQKRHATTGDVSIIIHTSGTGLLTYKANTDGMAVTEKIYDDSNGEEINSTFPEEAMHRSVDLAIIQADQEGYIKSYIVLPSNVWGIARNPLVNAGVINPYSKGIPWLIKAALARGRAGMVGKGLSLWSDVEIEELVDLYIIVYNALTNNPGTTGHGRDGYYFGITGEYSWYELSKEIGRTLVELGVHKEPEPDSFTRDELLQYFGSPEIGLYFGTNSRGVAKHSKSLGWNPKKGTRDMLASIKPEVEAILRLRQE